MVQPCRPGRGDLARAHDAFREHESRDLFYRAAIALVRLAKAGTVDLTVGEALAVLLRTWNSAYYRYHPPGTGHYAEVEALIETHGTWLESVAHRGIVSLTDADEQPLRTVFTGFETALGPVGAAKALHLLAPYFMPLWDRAIVAEYTGGAWADRDECGALPQVHAGNPGTEHRGRRRRRSGREEHPEGSRRVQLLRVHEKVDGAVR